jgi:hypothetical protein
MKEKILVDEDQKKRNKMEPTKSRRLCVGISGFCPGALVGGDFG